MFFFGLLLLYVNASLVLSAAPPILPHPRATIYRPICMQRRSWTTPLLRLPDCATAIRLWGLEIEPLGKKPFEFLALNTSGTTRRTWQYTPVKYPYKSCTLAIVMPHDLNPRDLGLPAKTKFPATDIATYFDLKLAAEAVLTECLRSEAIPQGGWWSIGRKGSVGLYIWATGSEMDDKVRGF